VFAVLDVDKKSIAATFSSHQGFIRSLSMPYKVEDLLNHVRNHFADQKVAFVYEAGPTGYGLYVMSEAVLEGSRMSFQKGWLENMNCVSCFLSFPRAKHLIWSR
jgi:hypothetical protein